MPVYKMVPAILIGGLLLATGVFWFMPGLRPGFVQRWFDQARGYTPATSAEDALDKLRKAIEKRDYDVAARLYLTGDYLEQFIKGRENARELASALDELKDVMKTTGVQSDKVTRIIYWMDPFPAFKYEVKNTSAEETVALMHWKDDVATVNVLDGNPVKIDPLILHALLPTGTPLPVPLTVKVKQADGVWKVEIPIRHGDRHIRDCIQTLEKKATNYRNAIRDVKSNIKNNPAVKEDFEREFRANLNKSF